MTAVDPAATWNTPAFGRTHCDGGLGVDPGFDVGFGLALGLCGKFAGCWPCNEPVDAIFALAA